LTTKFSTRKLTMPAIRCSKCGGFTNTAVSNWLEPKIREDKKAYECYAKVVNGKWIKGCAYDNCDPYTKSSVDKLIGM
jgi:hypothetical protein